MRLLLFLALATLIACKAEQQYMESQLVGTWNSVEWLDKTNDKKVGMKAVFNFESETKYSGTFGSTVEQGKYWISDDKLHTIAEGKAEKKVRILKLTNDSLILGMNRAGTLEELTLTRTK